MAAQAPISAGISFGTPAGRWVLAVAAAGSGMAFLDGTVVNVALPHIGRSFHASTATLQWVLTGYLLTLAALILIGGALGDRLGRRRTFVAGVGLFTAASLLCAIAPSATALIAARFVQGIGGALLTPGSLAMIESAYRPLDRARAIGAWSGLTGVASALGPLLGGFLVAAVSWRAIFLINLPIGVFVGISATRYVPETRDPGAARGPLDVPGAILTGLGLAGTTYALIEAPTAHASVAVLLAGVAGALALALFLVREHVAVNPMLPLGMFAVRQFSAANLVTFAVWTALAGVFFLLVAFLQVAVGYSAVAAGAASLPVTLLMLLLSGRSGALATRVGPRLQMSVGPLVIAAGLVMMARLGRRAGYVESILPAVVVFGIGLTLVVAPVTATVLGAADPERSGIASAINNAVARVGGLLAVALLPWIAGLGGHRFLEASAMTTGFHRAMLVCAGLSIAGGLVAAALIRNPAPPGPAPPDGST